MTDVTEHKRQGVSLCTKTYIAMVTPGLFGKKGMYYTISLNMNITVNTKISYSTQPIPA